MSKTLCQVGSSSSVTLEPEVAIAIVGLYSVVEDITEAEFAEILPITRRAIIY